jgi:Uncharacterized conserved protein (DUF2278)
MGLREGYGVLIGTKVDLERDDPSRPGHFKHSHLTIDAGSVQYDCAIDTDSAGQPDGHQWSIINLNPDDFSTVLQLADGWNPLDQTPDSGALDYIRSPAFQPHKWVAGDWQDASDALETFVGGGNKFYVYGEPFGAHGRSTRRSAHRGSARGVHNIHQNQGSPIGGGHDAENGTWQDGALILQKDDGSLVAFLNKFKSEVDSTDDDGNPSTDDDGNPSTNDDGNPN